MEGEVDVDGPLDIDGFHSGDADAGFQQAIALIGPPGNPLVARRFLRGRGIARINTGPRTEGVTTVSFGNWRWVIAWR